MKKLLLILLSLVLFTSYAAPKKKKSRSRRKSKTESVIKSVNYPCSFDDSKQRALVWFAKGDKPRPLIVVLHTWSCNFQKALPYAEPAVKYNFHMIAPDFRGRNNAGKYLSMGSDAAVEDIVSAVEWMKKRANVDPDKIYLMGGSGGGHMALLAAGRHPEIWAGVSVWCPITDLKKWCEFHKGNGYGKHIIDTLHGDPRTEGGAAKEAAKRSPVTWLENAKNVNIDIGTGINDGHTGPVPIDHSLNAFNILAGEDDKIPQEHIELLTQKRKVPAGTAPIKDAGYGKRKVLYRKSSGNCRVTIFSGAHDILTSYSYKWLAQQKKGKAAVWKEFKDDGKAQVLTK